MLKHILTMMTVAVICTAPAKAADPVAVDLELAFVVDASGSIDAEETMLQRQGYADALVHPKVLRAISGGFKQSIAVAYIEFAGLECVRVSIPWMRIGSAAEARAFGNKVLALPMDDCWGGNAVGDALMLGIQSIETNNFEGTRRVIDISGDGPNTMGTPASVARDLAVSRRITINALVIDRPEMPDLDQYFKEVVIGGRRSFMLKVEDRKSFAQGILKKLILEIADRDPDDQKAALNRR